MIEQPSPPVLRIASVADLAAIVRLENACFPEEDERFNARQIHRLIMNPRAAVVLVDEGRDSGIIGWAAGLTRKTPAGCAARLYAIGILPAARGRRVGRLLAERILSELARRGARSVVLEVREDNVSALALYRALGFRVWKRLPAYYGTGRDGLRLRLAIEDPPPLSSVDPGGG